MVVLRLGGPDEAELSGSVELSPQLLGDVLNGRLELLIYTSEGLDGRMLVPLNPP